MAVVTAATAASNAWAKIKFYYDHSLSSLAATSTASGYDVDYLINRLEINKWKGTSTATQYITFDAGAGNTYKSDYVAISGHNLFTADSLVTVQYSDDNFSADINDAYTEETPTNDNEYVKEFTAFDETYSRIKISSNSVAPEMAIAYWGELTELDWATGGLAPNNLTDKAQVNVSENGFVAGIHNKYKERSFVINFNDAESDLYDKIKAWYEDIGMQNFFMAWEYDQHSEDIYLMRSDGKFKAALSNGGLYRNISINLLGRGQV